MKEENNFRIESEVGRMAPRERINSVRATIHNL